MYKCKGQGEEWDNNDNNNPTPSQHTSVHSVLGSRLSALASRFSALGNTATVHHRFGFAGRDDVVVVTVGGGYGRGQLGADFPLV